MPPFVVEPTVVLLLVFFPPSFAFSLPLSLPLFVALSLSLSLPRSRRRIHVSYEEEDTCVI
jgi:hypothetical protein